ncbi:MAG TPA: AraC family transcriptional regulator [Bacteroidia bacterium]|nr:AraC family transcriptional regulator [Bacteroidia bacterium]
MQNIVSNVLDSLQVVYGKAEVKETLSAFEFNGEAVQKNTLLQLNKGHMFAGNDLLPLQEGEFYFVPAGANFFARFGRAGKNASVSPENLDAATGQSIYMGNINSFQNISEKNTVFTVFQFGTLLHKAVPFFSLLGLKPFVLPADEQLKFFLHQLCMEEEQEKVGKSILIKNYSSEIVILLFRYLVTQKQFSENIEKVNYLFDARLVRIIKYIGENLGKDLSNSRLAEVGLLSEDYISQFFRSLTKRNLQEYVEEQRLKKAYDLVLTTSESMKEIAVRVGFKDPAYFSRRFKHKYDMKATGVRKTEKMMHIVAA